MNNYKAPYAEELHIEAVSIIMTSYEEGENQFPINPRSSGNTPA